MLRAGLSAKGFEKSREHHAAERTTSRSSIKNFDEYGEWLYHLTVMGEPSATEPWGWQLDGHHLVINYFVLGDQVVMTPTFMGSEPVTATAGSTRAPRCCRTSRTGARVHAVALDRSSRSRRTIQVAKTGNNALAQAFRDNLVLDYAGVRAAELDWHSSASSCSS